MMKRGRSQIVCEICELLGKKTVFFMQEKLREHLSLYHQDGKGCLFQDCVCGVAIQMSLKNVEQHAKLCELKLNVHKDAGMKRSRRGTVTSEPIIRNESNSVGEHCIICNCVVFGSRNTKEHHLIRCSQNVALAKEQAAEASALELDDCLDIVGGNYDDRLGHDEEEVQMLEAVDSEGRDVGGEIEVASAQTTLLLFGGRDAPQKKAKGVEQFLFHGLRASGIQLSDRACDVLMQLVSSQVLLSKLNNKDLSRDFSSSLKRDEILSFEFEWHGVKDLAAGERMWLRNPACVFRCLQQDTGFINTVGSSADTLLECGNSKFADKFCHFGAFGKRKGMKILETGDLDLFYVSLGLWGDGGQTQKQKKRMSHFLLCVFVLNGDKTIARRADCIYPVAFCEPKADIIRCLQFVVQLFKENQAQRLVIDGRTRNCYFSIDQLSG